MTNQELLNEIKSLSLKELHQTAAEKLVLYTDELLVRNNIEKIHDLFNKINVRVIHPSITTGLIAVTQHNQHRIGKEWLCFRDHVLNSLHDWNYSEERRNRLEKRFSSIV